ncbi:hypothetical protein [Streptomyces sp. NPDC058613]|uniref:hypothetical protein n=1 Tax=Streptomyces sp. NPDC058613 TaxID=3346556 RepID=UPI003664703E
MRAAHLRAALIPRSAGPRAAKAMRRGAAVLDDVDAARVWAALLGGAGHRGDRRRVLNMADAEAHERAANGPESTSTETL